MRLLLVMAMMMRGGEVVVRGELLLGMRVGWWVLRRILCGERSAMMKLAALLMKDDPGRYSHRFLASAASDSCRSHRRALVLLLQIELFSWLLLVMMV